MSSGPSLNISKQCTNVKMSPTRARFLEEKIVLRYAEDRREWYRQPGHPLAESAVSKQARRIAVSTPERPACATSSSVVCVPPIQRGRWRLGESGMALIGGEVMHDNFVEDRPSADDDSFPSWTALGGEDVDNDKDSDDISLISTSGMMRFAMVLLYAVYHAQNSGY